MKIEFKQSQADYFNYVIQKYGGSWELSEGVIILQNEDDYFRIEHNNVTTGKLYTAWHKNHFNNKNDFHKLAQKMHDYIIENTDIKELH